MIDRPASEHPPVPRPGTTPLAAETARWPDLRVLAVVSRKGGAGKTTLALNLAVAAERRGTPALILDVVDATLGQRAAFVYALTAGQGVVEHEPKGKAAREVDRLSSALMGHPAMRSIRTRTAETFQATRQPHAAPVRRGGSGR